MNRNYSILQYFSSPLINYSIFFVCPRKPFHQINNFSRGFILKLGSQKRRIINAHLR